MIKFLIQLAEKNLLPDFLLRFGIRHLLRKRLKSLIDPNQETNKQNKIKFIEMMDQAKIAEVPELANQQHYEITSDFYDLCLGLHKKYSSCFWDSDTTDLNHAEKEALEITCSRADIQDGLTILELGCGWGSLTLWMAQHYPNSHITAVSNSASQRKYILDQANDRGLTNITIITCDMNHLRLDQQFDRIVSVEMIEHMRNHRKLFNLIATWLKPTGLFFMHIFVHKSQPYLFEVIDEDDWMSQYFFSGGMMPSLDLPHHFQDSIKLKDQWVWPGRHYEKTANAWLNNLDANKQQSLEVLKKIYGKNSAKLWLQRWRIFFMACAELWGFNDGDEWLVGHYTFTK